MTSVGAAEHAVSDRAIYTCAMHPQVREPAPGTCPICRMALTLETAGAIGFTPLLFGALASSAMLGVYFAILTLVSGWDFTVSEFARFWYFVVALAVGFGVQIGLYVYLRQRLAYHHAGSVVATTGTTSTVAMLSCCSHYLVNVLPVIGAAGLVTLVAEYQTELFWLGLAFNAAGIAFIVSRIWQAGRHA